MGIFSKLFGGNNCKHNPLDLENGFVINTVDDFGYKQAVVAIPNGGFVSFVYNGKEVFRIDQNGGRNVV